MAHCVPTILSFIRSDSDFNRRYIAPSAEVNTGVYEDHAVEIEDARPNRESFTLDTAGFILADHKSEVRVASFLTDSRSPTSTHLKVTLPGGITRTKRTAAKYENSCSSLPVPTKSSRSAL